jgi:hypothetical protein
MKHQSAYFEDDYTACGDVDETPELPGVHIEYRPLNHIQTVSCVETISKASPNGLVAVTDVLLKMCVKHLVKWDLAKLNGTIVDCHDVEELKKVAPQIIDKVIGIIRGDRQSTLNPSDEEKKARELLKNC